MARNPRRAPRSARTPQPPFEGSRGEDVYEVEAVEAKRRKCGLNEYFVRWKDHAPSENTREQMVNLQGAEVLVNDFETQWQVVLMSIGFANLKSSDCSLPI